MSAPVFLVIAGPNGSGKSSASGELLRARGLDQPAALDPDAIQKQLLADDPSREPLDALRAAQRETEEHVAQSVGAGVSVAVETVLSTTKYLALVQVARAQGMRVVMVFITTRSVNLNVMRVAARVQAGGHDVPEEKIRSRWQRAHENLATMLPLLDELVVLDNSAAGGPPELLAEKRDGIVSRLRDDLRTRWPEVDKALGP